MKLNKSFHSVYNLSYHLIIVTKYRKKIFNQEILTMLKDIVESIIEGYDCELIEFNGEEDHIHILLESKPNIKLSQLINSIKTVTARQLNKKLKTKHNHLWSPSYFIVSCGNVKLEVLKRYVNNQKSCPPNPSQTGA